MPRRVRVRQVFQCACSLAEWRERQAKESSLQQQGHICLAFCARGVPCQGHGSWVRGQASAETLTHVLLALRKGFSWPCARVGMSCRCCSRFCASCVCPWA